MTVIQDVAAQIGSVTEGASRPTFAAIIQSRCYGRGGAPALRQHRQSGRRSERDGRGDGAAAGREFVAYTLGFGLICVILEIFLNYRQYSAVLKFATLSLFAYVAVVFIVRLDWGEALRGVLIPHVEWTAAFGTGFVAILGTTISPYLFFWQAAQEIEEEKRHHAKPLHAAPRRAGAEMARIRRDTLIGMSFSNLVAIFIVFAAAATLHAKGVTTIETAAQAAQALRPVAGRFAFLLFALGIIGTGLLAVPVLAGSAAYAVLGNARPAGQPRCQAAKGPAVLWRDRRDDPRWGAARDGRHQSSTRRSTGAR